MVDNCAESEKKNLRQKVREFCSVLLEKLKEKPPVYLLATIVEVNKADQIERDETVKICDDLATKYDVIRVEYWNYIKRTLLL